MRGAETADRPHTPVLAGSNPAPATFTDGERTMIRAFRARLKKGRTAGGLLYHEQVIACSILARLSGES